MLEFLDSPYDESGDDAEAGTDLQSEAEGEDLEGGYTPEFKAIHFIDPGVIIGITGAVKEGILTKDEGRELLGYEPLED